MISYTENYRFQVSYIKFIPLHSFTFTVSFTFSSDLMKCGPFAEKSQARIRKDFEG